MTAIVTVADDGGLRNAPAGPGDAPRGDIRHCMEALANVEPVMGELLSYRFPKDSGSLGGQSFRESDPGGAQRHFPSFDQAVARMSEVLAITGRVLPVTNEDVRLEATFENGTSVVGSPRSAGSKKEQDCRIRKVRLLPEHPPPCPKRCGRSGRRTLFYWVREAFTPASSPICW